MVLLKFLCEKQFLQADQVIKNQAKILAHSPRTKEQRKVQISPFYYFQIPLLGMVMPLDAKVSVVLLLLALGAKLSQGELQLVIGKTEALLNLRALISRFTVSSNSQGNYLYHCPPLPHLYWAIQTQPGAADLIPRTKGLGI
jgi:hypothetical protein